MFGLVQQTKPKLSDLKWCKKTKLKAILSIIEESIYVGSVYPFKWKKQQQIEANIFKWYLFKKKKKIPHKSKSLTSFIYSHAL